VLGEGHYDQVKVTTITTRTRLELWRDRTYFVHVAAMGSGEAFRYASATRSFGIA